MKFEWDESKAAANVKKHGVSFFEAIEALQDPLSLTAYDEEHSDIEDRFVTIGHSGSGRLVVVVHADRDDAIRIVSARGATRGERKEYEDGNAS